VGFIFDGSTEDLCLYRVSPLLVLAFIVASAARFGFPRPLTRKKQKGLTSL